MIHTNTHIHIFTHNMYSKKKNKRVNLLMFSLSRINRVCNTHDITYTQITWKLRGQSRLFVSIMFNYHLNVSLQWSLYISWYTTELTLVWTTHDFTQMSISFSTQHTHQTTQTYLKIYERVLWLITNTQNTQTPTYPPEIKPSLEIQLHPAPIHS